MDVFVVNIIVGLSKTMLLKLRYIGKVMEGASYFAVHKLVIL